MKRTANGFWEMLEARLPAEARGSERDVARSVLVLLRRRIRPEEAQHVKAELPDELKRLWAEPGVGLAEERTGRSIDEIDHNAFIAQVRDAARLPDLARAAEATAAVFAAVRQFLSGTEADHVESQLPAGLKALWRGEHRDGGPHREQGPSPFWEFLSTRLEGRVPASTTEIACVVLAHLRGRLPRALVADIRGALPPDLRDYWVAPEGGIEREEEPERFYGRIAEEIGTTDLDAARHAAAATFGALRRVLPPAIGARIGAELPEELRGLWQGM
ncbi:MAG TPA: DUF2267 domain-containing protein [Longimicrobiales bacterium]